MSVNQYEEPIFIPDLLEKTRLDDTDLLVAEDTENTKKINFRNLRLSMISDNEQPADYRLYSSLKMQSLVDDVARRVELGVGGVEEDIINLQKNSVTHAELKTAIDEVNSHVANLDQFDLIAQELENTRKKSEPISGADLAYGSEVDKIHLQHLGEDILDAMTGKTKITPPSVPEGGWRSEDLANSSIAALKLCSDFTYRGTYREGNLNRLVETGVYEVAATVEGVPHYGNDMDETRLLEVIRYGIDGKWIIQRVYYKEESGETRPYFERKGLFAKLSMLQFRPHYEITSTNRVEPDLLGDHYNNRGTLTSGDLFSITADGNYLCEATVKNLPSEDRYFVNVRSFGNRREYEAKKADVSGCVTWSCYEYRDSNYALQRTAWSNSINIEKSKFDGAILHIFGDGTSYGLGVSDIRTNPYTAILSNKYGYRINNHAFADATAGNYDDNVRTQSSLLTQIDTATGLATSDEVYILIMIGAEDYRSSIAMIGNEDHMNDTTFMGSLNLAIEKLYKKAPNCRIIFVTPFYQSSTNPGDGLDSDTNLVNSKYLRDYADAMVTIARRNHIPCLNLYDECAINKYNASKYLNNMGVYPSDKGHALIAEKIHSGMCRFY